MALYQAMATKQAIVNCSVKLGIEYSRETSMLRMVDIGTLLSKLGEEEAADTWKRRRKI
jgi:hypothetical protein